MMGGIEEQMETFLHERIFSEFAQEDIYQETEKQFSIRVDDETPVGMWHGEFWGKWILSACRAARYKNDEKLKVFIREGALRVIATADSDGYIGTYKDPGYVFPLDYEKGFEAVGWHCNWNWNIWCRKYTLWALLEAYQLTGDEAILQGAERTTDQLLNMLEEKHIRLFDTGTFSGMPSGSILKPMLLLYRLTENRRYLDFCLTFVSEWEREDGKMPNLIANSMTGKPLHSWYPWHKYPYFYGWAKAYEMMSCLDGLLELYRVTGTQKYLTTVQNIYAQLREHEYNPLFSVGFNDIFFHASQYINAISEPCDVLHWMRVGYELFCLTGEASYMDDFERAFLNPFLAASFSDGKWGARGVRTCGRHLVAVRQSGMNHSHCCVNNMPRGYMNACQAFVLESSGDLYVNMYTDYACHLGEAQVAITGSYLENGRVEVTFDVQKACTAYLRIPSWSRKTLVNGEWIECAGSYSPVVLIPGKNVVTLVFDMNPRAVESEVEAVLYEQDDPRVVRFHTGNDVPVEYMATERKVRILYGPLLLTRSLKNGNTQDEMFHSATLCGKGYSSCCVESVPSDTVRNAYRVTLDNGTDCQEIRMCDYATGTNEWSKDEPGLFNIYL